MTDQLFKIPAHYTVQQVNKNAGKVEFYRLQLLSIVPELNNTQLTALAYIRVYGKDASKKIIEDGILTTKSSFHCYKHLLKTEGYLVADDNEVILNPEIHLVEFNLDKPLLVLFNINPTEIDNVQHKHYRKNP